MSSCNWTPGRICRFFGDQASSIQVRFHVAPLFCHLKLCSSRHGQLEDRDPYRLKDRNGEPVLCFRCGTSALPPGVAASAPATKRARMETSGATHPESGRSIVSCDYCHLHWHLDCVDPPMSCMPPWGRKWMCPNHADRIFVGLNPASYYWTKLTELDASNRSGVYRSQMRRLLTSLNLTNPTTAILRSFS